MVRTVLGDRRPDLLGRTDYHEHLRHVSPLLPGEELDDPDRSEQEAASLSGAGVDAIVDLTPIGLGRDPAFLRAVSERTGLGIVMATGVHREAHYPQDHPVRALDERRLQQRFVRDVRESAIADAEPLAEPVRAGILKVGIGYWSISAFEARVLDAAAAAHAATGVPVACHLELGSAAWEASDRLARAGVARDRQVLAHCDRNPDPGLHAELAAAGCYLGYDGVARPKHWPDSTVLDCLVEVAARGGADRLLLGGDVARRSSYVSYGGMPGLAYLPERFLPRLRERAPELETRIMCDNPARLLAFAPR
ncbi:aryldialkylphosphatase [Egibacter rhizosphaerae]|uniref:Aryldialkylphosphatase n=1 Tax=Egibacter rhizosphaerae TaxID=1670831 RepID=A0A411YLH4_9ACTN|nr:aryldialkylphosphatase [Egibacter rhizosphaerae]